MGYSFSSRTIKAPMQNIRLPSPGVMPAIHAWNRPSPGGRVSHSRSLTIQFLTSLCNITSRR